LIENANALGEPPEDPLLLFSNLYGFWVSNYVAFDDDVIRALARKFLVLAEERGASVPLMIAHRIMGCSLASTGDLVEARVHFDCAVALYDPAAHRPLKMVVSEVWNNEYISAAACPSSRAFFTALSA